MRSAIRSFGFAVSVFVFVCLLITGSPRLIAREETDAGPAPVREICDVPSRMTSGVSPAANSACGAQREQQLQRKADALIFEQTEPVMKVLSDANGNVLGCRSYMHEVYQAFVLSDGFA